jgi:hypothetical protein
MVKKEVAIEKITEEDIEFLRLLQEEKERLEVGR